MSQESEIRAIVDRVVRGYSAALKARHLSEKNDPEGTLNRKIHNIFVASLGPQVQFWSAMSRSLDSSFGSMLERLGFEIAQREFTVYREVRGTVSVAQAQFIAGLMEEYRTKKRKPAVADYQELRTLGSVGGAIERHYSDYFLVDAKGGHHLIELKAGGDLDNKKAVAEKQAILNQYAILVNNVDASVPVYIKFATAYNKFGEGNLWAQGSVRQCFAPDELLIGQDFWNYVCASNHGYEWVVGAFRDCAPALAGALITIQEAYS